MYQMENDAVSHEASGSSIPSCESCRKRKLKCPRQQPSCVNCNKFEVPCVYDYDRKRPGFKVGVVESLNRRLEILENALPLNQDRSQASPVSGPVDASTNALQNVDPQQQYLSPVVDVLSSLTKEVHNLSSAIASIQQYAKHDTADSSALSARSQKRKRAEDDANEAAEPAAINASSPISMTTDSLKHLKDGYVDELVDCYFNYINPWISILHEPSFRDDLRKTPRKAHLSPIIDGIMVVADRLTSRYLSEQSRAEQISKARQRIILAVTDDICLENLQAVLLLAFAELVGDNTQRVSSLLGIIVGAIEHLQLSREVSNKNVRGGIFRRPPRVPASTEWIAEEEKRRALWNAFLLDRFFAAISGCSPVLSGSNINRRLPVCAGFWYTNEPRMTPYLRVSDSSTAGLNCAFDLEKSSTDAELTRQPATARGGESTPSSGVGSLAFYLETVESMSLVVSHILQQSVDFNNKNDIFRWLTRFKELDLYLMRWKMRLPQQWADSGVSRNIMPGIMDCAMTVANTTHNTCLVLLHEQIAYADSKLDWVGLPRNSSAEVCVGAAMEVCTILGRFLEQCNARFPPTPQLGLCAFLCATTLLRHTRKYPTQLAQQFWVLLSSLDDMNRRWQTVIEPPEMRSKTVFSRFAERLRTMHTRCELDPSYQIDTAEPLYNYAPERSRSARYYMTPDQLPVFIEQKSNYSFVSPENSGPTPVFRDGRELGEVIPVNHQGGGFDSSSSIQWNGMGYTVPLGASLTEDDLLAMSQSLMEPDFTGMDRIISFDDMMLSGISEAPMNWEV